LKIPAIEPENKRSEIRNRISDFSVKEFKRRRANIISKK
jgi:hypothetical protein